MNGFEVYKIYLAIKLHFTSKTEVTTFIDTADEQLQNLKPSLKEGTDIFFTNLVALITALLWSITLLVTLSIILIYGLAIYWLNW